MVTNLEEFSKRSRKRLVGLAFFIFCLFAVLIAQFYRIQIIEGDQWTKQAEKQHYFTVKEPFIRGTFYSNTVLKKLNPEFPQKYVVDIQKFHLYIDPLSIPLQNREEVIKKLTTSLKIPHEDETTFSSNFARKSHSRKLALWLDKEKCDEIFNWWHPFARQHAIPRNALYTVTDYQRSYPFGKLLGQVLHTVQTVKDEKTAQAFPTGGLELYFNKYLKGKQGKRRLMRSPKNSLEIGEEISKPENGADIHLTINHYLQAIAEEELAKGVKNTKAKSGWVVMLDPFNGEILALAQYPFFYPPDYQKYFNNPLLIEQTKIKAITDSFEPGSVMKPFTIALALSANKILEARGEKAIFSPLDKMPTYDSHFRGRKPLTDTHFHRYLNMDMAIQKSSNIYVARLIEKVLDKLGKEWYKEQLHKTFGFGEKTLVELPAESQGMVPTPGKKHPNGTLEWSVSTPYSLAMGHNIQTTSLQLARAYAIFANGGYLVHPTLVRKIVKTHQDGSQEILVDNTKPERKLTFPKVLDTDIVESLKAAMKYTTKPGGTARKGEIWGYTEAGKTGTSHKVVNGSYSKTLFCSTFVGITPVKDSAFVLVVTVDDIDYCFMAGIGKIHHGGGCAAPIFREIAKRSLDYLGIAPDDPHGYPVNDPRYNAEQADWMPETRKLKEIYEKWNNIIDKVPSARK
jgi:cell division protein FtsI (penicillin-binding protein 3)